MNVINATTVATHHISSAEKTQELVLLILATVIAIAMVVCYYFFIDKPRQQSAGYLRVTEQTKDEFDIAEDSDDDFY